MKSIVRMVAATLLLAVSQQAVAQTRPSAADARAMAQARPELIAQLQARLMGLGLSPAEIRQRLKAEGYPENLLDAYMPGGSADSAGTPSDDVFAAMRALGVTDTSGIDSLRTAARRERLVKSRLDSAFLDTLSRAALDDSTREAIRRILRSREAQRAVADSGYNVFGLNLFSGETSQFDANEAGAVDANYRIGPGDKLVLFLTGDVEASYPDLEVTRNGFIVIPSVGQIAVAGLTLSGLEDVLYDRLGRVYSGIRRGPNATTRFSINVARLGTNQVTVTGDVKQPGSYRISRAGTLLNALYAAQGPTETGSLRNVELHRGGTLVGTLDVYDYVLRGDASHDLRLENGDVIFVPPRGARVRIAGAVLRPATYELKQGENLATLVHMAGGFTARADHRRVQIDRIVPPGQRSSAGADHRLIDVSSDLLTSGSAPPEPLVAGDVVRVFEVPKNLSNRIAVDGDVWSPGLVGFSAGMHLSEAIKLAGGMRPDSYLGEIQITRVLPDSSLTMLRTAAHDTTGTVVNDYQLTDGDRIRVFSIADFRPERYVEVSGAVKKPGRIPYRDGMTLRDVVLLAGGLQESALLTEAEIAHMPENRAAGVTATTERVPLDSTYLFERAPNGRYLGPPGLAAPAAVAPDVPLRPYDAVLILRQPDWSMQRQVAVYGEVKYPGRYTLKTKSERLSDIIARAGGLNTDGYANGIVFVRKRDNLGRIGIDLPEVLKNSSYVDNLILADGDSVFIPAYSAVVTVKGEVNSPVAVAYVGGAPIDYYVRAAGGGTTKADEGKAYVTQPNGKVETRHRTMAMWESTPKPQPGSTVIVPAKDPADTTNWLAVTSTATSILGSLVAIAALLRR